jgi:hypothetical protein
MNVKQISTPNFWTRIVNFFSDWSHTIDYTIYEQTKERIIKENPQITAEEIDRLSEKELQQYMPEYYMYMHWPLM